MERQKRYFFEELKRLRLNNLIFLLLINTETVYCGKGRFRMKDIPVKTKPKLKMDKTVKSKRELALETHKYFENPKLPCDEMKFFDI